MRPIIIHYHLYKNAGTSVDAILQSNFGDDWVEVETQNGQKLSRTDLETFIQENKNLKAISSHTAEITLPDIPDIMPIPIIFFRHPIDRIRSVYAFESHQKDSEDLACQVASRGGFEDYYLWRLASGAPWQVTNFQCFKMKDFVRATKIRDAHLYRRHCLQAIDALPFVGIVEEFGPSMDIYKAQFDKFFPDFELGNVHLNSSANRDGSLQNRLKKFRSDIGPKLFNNLYQLNGMDLECYYYLLEKNNNMREFEFNDA